MVSDPLTSSSSSSLYLCIRLMHTKMFLIFCHLNFQSQRFRFTYLRNRIQFDVIGGSRSDGICPTAGVSQGSILGPLFVIFFINDLLSSLPSCSGFADDLIFKAIRTS